MRRAGLPIALLILSFFAGRMLKSSPQKVDPPPQANTPTPTPTRTTTRSADATPAPTHADLSQSLRSTDTVDTLIALSKDDLYERLALWLVDASVEDMAAYWQATKNAEDIRYMVRDLVFLRYTLTDPLSALSESTDPSDTYYLWKAWTKNDPVAAFQHAMANNPYHLGAVMETMAHSNSKLALKLLNAHPEIYQLTNINTIIQVLCHENPEAVFKINHPNQLGHPFDPHAIAVWLRKDPHEAFRWFIANRLRPRDSYNDLDEEQFIIKHLSNNRPDLIEEFAEMVPPSSLRWKLEAAAFDALLEKDPEKAIVVARENPSPTLAVEQLVKIALKKVSTDVHQTKSLLSEILSINPDFLTQQTTIHVPKDRIRNQQQSEPAKQLIAGLIDLDPQAAFEILIEPAKQHSLNETTNYAAYRWVETDHQSFANWITNHPDTSIQKETYSYLVNGLRQAKEYELAVTYALKMDEAIQTHYLRPLMREWNSIAPSAAAEWSKENEVNLQEP
jgi:hypothetical protein